jgi:sugar O-acyltransferase (sialic acid O-acetyltransferase NeuD family)
MHAGSAVMTLYILGAGGHGRVVADVASLMGEEDIRFLDRSWPERTQNQQWPIVARDTSGLPAGSRLFLALGDNAVRQKIFVGLPVGHFQFPVLVHPRSYVATNAKLASGTVVMAMAVVNPGSVIGEHVIINTGATVDHDCSLSDFVHVSPGAHLAGGVKIGSGSWIGIGACICEYREIGQNALVAAGASVVQNVASGERVFGVPASPKR